MVAPQAAGTSTIPPVVGRARTLIVDDHPLLRVSLGEVLARYPDFEVVGEAGSVAEALAWLAHHIVDVAIIDVVLPDAHAVTLVDLSLIHISEPTRLLSISY